MSLSDNKQKIEKLFNKMQKAIINFDKLIFPNEYIAFDIYKTHIEALMINIENNLIGKLSLDLFRFFFEDTQDFKEYEEKKANYINLLVDKLNAKNEDEEEEAQNNIESEIITILFNIKKKEYRIPMNNLISSLKKQLLIKCELYYLLLIYLVEKGFDLHILIDYLTQILKEKYPDSRFIFSEVLETKIKFEEFIEIFVNAINNAKNYDYAIFQFKKETKTILISYASLDEIAKIISSASKEKKKPPKNKIRDIKLDKKEEEDKTHTKPKVENYDKEKEKTGKNIKYSNEKDKEKINNPGNIDIPPTNLNNNNKNISDESNKISLEELKKLIDANDEKFKNYDTKIKILESEKEKMKNDIIQLKDDNNQLKNDNEQLKDENKSLNTKITNINCSLSNKIMNNKKK